MCLVCNKTVALKSDVEGVQNLMLFALFSVATLVAAQDRGFKLRFRSNRPSTGQLYDRINKRKL